MITGPTTTGESTLRTWPIRPVKPTTASISPPSRIAPAIVCMPVPPSVSHWSISGPSVASLVSPAATADQSTGAAAWVVATMAKNAAMNENEMPWMIGSREPQVLCSNVATPLHNITDEINKAVLVSCRFVSCVRTASGRSAGTGQSTGPKISGTATVEPNIVSTCCRLSPTARTGGGRSSRP